MISVQDQERILALLHTLPRPKGGSGKVQVLLTFNIAPGGTVHRIQYEVSETGDLPTLAKVAAVR